MQTMAASLVLLAASILMISASLVNASLSSSEKEEILTAHNYFRGKVDPIATNMQRLDWDDELAFIAQFWAANCLYGYNEYRDFQSSEFDYVGEIIANSTSSYTNYTQLISSWFSMGKRYNYYQGYCRNYDGTRSTDGEECSSYKQLVWAKTYSVGCGAMRCENLYTRDENSIENAVYLVCNYGPGGSYQGQYPYKTGFKICSTCPSRKSNCVNKLCTRNSAALSSFINDGISHWITLFILITLYSI